MSHSPDVDRECEYCKAQIMVHVPHECDPFVCRECKGSGETKRLKIKCSRCQGTGRWKPEPHEEDCEVCYPKS